MSKIKLKKCPFCGEKPEIWIIPFGRTNGSFKQWQVVCRSGANCPGGASTNPCETEQEAVAAWNTRAYEEDGRKTGKRIVINTAWGKRTVCSECGTRLSAIKAHYCHHCGVKLDVKEVDK